MTITTDATRSIHSLYNSLISRDGLEIPYTMSIHFYFEQFLVHGFTHDDLRLVVGYIHRRMREKKREMESLLPRNLLTNPDHFREDLAMARAEARVPTIDKGRASTLISTGRSGEPEGKPARSVGDVLAATKAFEDFKALKSIL